MDHSVHPPAGTFSGISPLVPGYWSGVFAMTLCVFALIAFKFMPVNLLAPMADELRVAEGMAKR